MTISENKIRQRKKSIPTNFSNSLSKSLDRKPYTWKNHETQFQKNKILKDEIEKINYIKNPK